MTGGCERRHATEACAEDLGDLRKVSELSSRRGRRRLTFGARRGLAAGAARGGGGDGGGCRWKSQHRKIVYHSSYVEKPFNSKVIKSFLPELRSRTCFFFCLCVSGFLCYLYMSYEHSMSISHIRIIGMLHTHHFTFDYKNLKKRISSIIRTDILEFVTANPNLNFASIQLFIVSHRLQIRMYIVYIK